MSTYDSAQQINNKNFLNNNILKKSSFNVDFQKSKHFKKTCIDYAVQMEHSYSRDCRPVEGINGLTTRTLMVHKPPQCPSCHAHPLDEGLDSDEANHPPIPPYNENAAKDAMNETTKISQNVRNQIPDDDEWEERVQKLGWTTAQEKLFSKITRILDLDNLGRLATIGRQHEPVHRRVIIDRSVHRFRQAFASISWDSRLTQWLHGILMDNLPSTYMAIYLDVLQTLKTKLPTLMDKMLFGKPMNINQELLTPVMKKQWEPIIPQKQRKLPSNAVILIVPSTSYIVNGMSPRMQKWCQLFTTMGQVVQVQIPNANALSKQPVDQVCEHLVHLSRVKVQELRREQPNSHILLVGFNAGASIALQVSLTENVNSVVSLGFAYNTINGVRGTPDDQILEITTPIMFVIGQNSARTSQEEMESLREKMQSETSLIVVGSADDVLRVPKSKRQIEGVTQSMVDSMIMDEIFEFVRNCIQNPPGPRQVNSITIPVQVALSQAKKLTVAANHPIYASTGAANAMYGRKRKISQSGGSDAEMPPTKVKYVKNSTLIGRPRTRPLPNTASSKLTQVKSHQLIPQVSSNEILNMAIQSILPEHNSDKLQSSKIKDDEEDESQILSALELLTQSPKKEIKSSTLATASAGIMTNVHQQGQTRTALLATPPTSTQKIKMIPTNQFIHVKPPTQQNSQRIYTIKTSPMLSGNATSQGQVFTVKTAGSQLTPSSVVSSANTIVLNSPPKFTVYKSSANMLSTHQAKESGGKSATSSSADLSSTNILDLPILFADSDGNIHDTAPISASSVSTPTSSSTASTIILNSQQHQSSSSSTPQQTGILSQSSSGKLILNTTNSSMMQKPKPNKLVYINRSTMKPMSANIISSKTLPPLKYTKLVVTNPKTAAPSLVPKASGQQRLDAEKGITTITIQKPSTTVSVGGGMVKTTGQSAGTITGVNSGTKQFQPIIINVDSDKTGAFKNMLKVTGASTVADPSQIKQTILLKPGGLRTLPVSGLKPGILNRNLTVRKVVNILQAKPGTTISQIASLSTANVTTTPTTVVASLSSGGTDGKSSSAGAQSNQNVIQIQSSEN